MANEPKEVELKLSVTPADFGALKAHPMFTDLLAKPASKATLSSTYYDTARSDLNEQGVTLRVRRENGGFVQTVKAAGPANGGLERSEWEQPVRSKRPDLDAAADSALGP